MIEASDPPPTTLESTEPTARAPVTVEAGPACGVIAALVVVVTLTELANGWT